MRLMTASRQGLCHMQRILSQRCCDIGQKPSLPSELHRPSLMTQAILYAKLFLAIADSPAMQSSLQA